MITRGVLVVIIFCEIVNKTGKGVHHRRRSNVMAAVIYRVRVGVDSMSGFWPHNSVLSNIVNKVAGSIQSIALTSVYQVRGR